MPRPFVIAAIVLAAGMASLSADQNAPKPIPLGPIAPLDVAQLLDTYAAGRFDEAVSAVATAGDEIGRNLRRHWMVDAPLWIDADPVDRPRRLLVAAAFALETENIRVERGDWAVSSSPRCAGSCVLDWAQTQLVARGAPDQAERAWYLAAAALASGVRDWTYLYRPVVPQTLTTGRQGPPGPAATPLPGLMDRALTRFPGDPYLLLEQAMAAASRFSVTTEGARYTNDLGLPPSMVVSGRRVVVVDTSRLPQRETAIVLLRALTGDPIVGAEASLRLGYLYWTLGQDDAARFELGKAAEEARDADLKYLAHFLIGWTALNRNDASAAMAHLRAALGARPDSQSAAVALASLELQRGDAASAYTIAQASLDKRATDDDPWRLFLYGHHPRLPALLADLRRKVRP